MKLSIITINYNNREGLRKTIDSVINQTWQDFEWIIVDGGSTDGSKELIEETAERLDEQGWTSEHFSLFGFTAEDWKNGKNPSLEATEALETTETRSRKLLWCSEKDKGIYNAMNKGIVMAQGEYCLFLNSGDSILEKEVLSTVFSMEINHDLECFNQLFDAENGEKYSCKVTDKSFSVLFLLSSSLPHQATLIRRALFKTVGYYEERIKIVSDWKFFLQAIVFHNVTCKYRPVDFSKVQMAGVSLTETRLREQERDAIINAMFPPLIIQDYSAVRSLADVLEASWLSRKLYGLLYRFAIMIKKLRK